MPDPTFGQAGHIALREGDFAWSLDVVDRDGAIVASGRESDQIEGTFGQPVAWRLRADGTFDPTFGEGGKRRVLPYELGGDGGIADRLVVLPSGHVAVATRLYNADSRILVSILRPDGTIESSFGDAGVVETSHYFDGDLVGVGPNGRLLVTNTAIANSGYIAEVRAYLPDLPTLAPTITSLTPGKTALSVQWAPAEVETGGPVRVQHLIAYDGDTAAAHRLVAGDVRQASLTGLTNGKPYRMVVVPYTSLGKGLASDGISGTSAAGATAPVPATAVQNVTATPGRHFATVTWAPPANDGGTPIAAYSVIAVRPDTNQLVEWRNVPADVRTASVPTPVSGVAYDLYVLPVTSTGFGALAPAVHVTAVDAPPNAQPPQVSWATAGAAGPTGYVSWGPALERGEAATAFHVVVMRGNEMIAWHVASPDQRQAVVPIGTTGAAQAYVFAQSASGFGPIGSPITVR
jgi:hypothetical protein